MNPRLPKEGSLDGVLSRNPDPPTMNAGMPRMRNMDAYYAEQQAARDESSNHFESIAKLTAMGIDPEMLDRATIEEVKQLMAAQPQTENDIHRKSADIAFSMLKRDGPVEMCPECAEPKGDGSCSDCLDQQRGEGRYEELWGEDDDETYVSGDQRMSPHSSMGLYDEEGDPRLKEWLDGYFEGEDEPERTSLPYPQWKNQIMTQMYGLDTDDPITTAHDWDEDEARAQHWMQSDSCDCNMSQADKREYLQEMMAGGLEDNPNADLEEMYGELAEEMAFQGGGQGRAKKWMKSTGRCGHCGGQSEMDEEGSWRQHS